MNNLPRIGLYVVPGARAGMEGEKAKADLNKPWAAVLKRAGISGVRLHDLRHTFASVGAGGGLGLPVIGKLLGHSQASTTQRYAHIDIDPQKRAADDIGVKISNAMGGVNG